MNLHGFVDDTVHHFSCIEFCARREGADAIPLVVFSPHDANPVFAVQVRAALTKSRTSIDNLIATLCKRFADNSLPGRDKDVA